MTVNLATIAPMEIMPGYHGKMVHTQTMTMAFWDVQKDAVVAEHLHVHEQIMHVLEGEFEFTVGNETKICRKGDIVPVAPNVPHSGRALTPCRLLDVFSPVREEYKAP